VTPYVFNDDERQVGALIYSSSCHDQRTNTRRTVNKKII